MSRDADQDFEYAPVRVNRFGSQKKVYADGREEPYAADIVLASGTAATAETFLLAGGMDEGLFIDFVDIEWCLRCRKHGVPLLVVPQAVMRHSIGGKSTDLGVARVLVHSPGRCYYQIRNSFLLFRRDSVPKVLAGREFLVLLAHKMALIAAVSNRLAYLSSYAQGIYDGLKGVTGRNPRDI